MPRTLDGVHQLTLMLCARSRNTLWDDLPLFGDKPLKFLLVFVIDVDFLRVAEPACPLLSRHLAFFLAPRLSWCS